MISSLTNGDSVNPIMDLISKYDIKYVRLIVIDPNGQPKAMLVPEYNIPDTLNNGVAFDGSSVSGFVEDNIRLRSRWPGPLARQLR